MSGPSWSRRGLGRRSGEPVTGAVVPLPDGGLLARLAAAVRPGLLRPGDPRRRRGPGVCPRRVPGGAPCPSGVDPGCCARATISGGARTGARIWQSSLRPRARSLSPGAASGPGLFRPDRAAPAGSLRLVSAADPPGARPPAAPGLRAVLTGQGPASGGDRTPGGCRDPVGLARAAQSGAAAAAPGGWRSQLEGAVSGSRRAALDGPASASVVVQRQPRPHRRRGSRLWAAQEMVRLLGVDETWARSARWMLSETG